VSGVTVVVVSVTITLAVGFLGATGFLAVDLRGLRVRVAGIQYDA